MAAFQLFSDFLRIVAWKFNSGVWNTEGGGEARILGGMDAFPAEFPHQAQLQYMGRHLCGGAVISSVLVVTAAHCVLHKAVEQMKVVTGGVQLNRRENSVQTRGVRMIFSHENYSRLSHENDIALLLLSHELKLGRMTEPIALRQVTNYRSVGHAIVTGWGKTVDGPGAHVDILQKVAVPIVPRETCRSSYELYGQNITENMICAGSEGKDSCQGDSGGPLTCTTHSGQPFLCGLASFGLGCGRRDFPGVYTNVPKYYDWIGRTAAKINTYYRCPPNFFRCRLRWMCIPISSICDRMDDCGDRSDEEDCTFRQGRSQL